MIQQTYLANTRAVTTCYTGRQICYMKFRHFIVPVMAITACGTL